MWVGAHNASNVEELKAIFQQVRGRNTELCSSPACSRLRVLQAGPITRTCFQPAPSTAGKAPSNNLILQYDTAASSACWTAGLSQASYSTFGSS